MYPKQVDDIKHCSRNIVMELSLNAFFPKAVFTKGLCANLFEAFVIVSGSFADLWDNYLILRYDFWSEILSVILEYAADINI